MGVKVTKLNQERDDMKALVEFQDLNDPIHTRKRKIVKQSGEEAIRVWQVDDIGQADMAIVVANIAIEPSFAKKNDEKGIDMEDYEGAKKKRREFDNEQAGLLGQPRLEKRGS